MPEIDRGLFPYLAGPLLLVALACGSPGDRATRLEEAAGGSGGEELVPTDLTGVTIIPERWVSAWDTTSNLDSPAFWQGDEGSWVISTAKGTHDLWVHDATDGALLQRVGRQGSGPGEFNYPNGIFIVGDLLLVVERDNHRVQMLSLPDFQSLGWFGQEELVRPYGIALFPESTEALMVYVTDDYGNEVDPPEGEDPTGDFTTRVKEYSVRRGQGESPMATYRGAFGEARGPGALMVVESIQVDDENDLLLVADEHALELEVYDLEGGYREQTVGAGLYTHGDPEGIMLYRCGSNGYWILTDQGATRSVFHVLDRRSFELLGSFAGERTANTDGIWLTQASVPGLGQGALFALHDDGGVAAFSWGDIGEALGLSTGCRGPL